MLIRGGVGITPLLAIAHAARASGNRQVVFIHYARNAGAQGFRKTLAEWKAQYPQFSAYVVHGEESNVSATLADAIGFPSVAHLEKWLPTGRDVEAYFVGPKPFMAFMKHALQQTGVEEAQTHDEFFGPAEALR